MRTNWQSITKEELQHCWKNGWESTFFDLFYSGKKPDECFLKSAIDIIEKVNGKTQQVLKTLMIRDKTNNVF